MKHNIRQRVINEIGLPVVKVESVQGELGSGILDKSGKEIFEGDIVKDDEGRRFAVTFKQGVFCAGGNALLTFGELKVVGHSEE